MMRNWTPEIVNAFEHYNDLVREAECDRRVHPARVAESRLSIRAVARQTICRVEPVRVTRLCLVPSAA